MKEELSRKEVTREIWNGFDVCLKYRVELGSKVWKNERKTHILGNFRVMVHVVPCFSVSTSFRILAITCSFLILFE